MYKIKNKKIKKYNSHKMKNLYKKNNKKKIK